MIWRNTNILDPFLDKKEITTDKDKASIILLGAYPIDINEFPNVQFVFRVGVGTDNINFTNVPVGFPEQSTKDIIYEETSNFACYLIFKMLYDNKSNLDTWSSVPRNLLNTKTLLVIGIGNIGRRVYDKMYHIFDNVVSYDAQIDVASPSYDQADIISLHIPYSEENKNFFNKDVFKQLKDDAIIINTARGGIVNEDDLYEALTTTNMRAAFDAFWTEPYNGKLMELHPDKFYATPHMASTCFEFTESCYYDFIAFRKKISSSNSIG
jgi:phosphoglycerate dehydrogenase-like enzyme